MRHGQDNHPSTQGFPAGPSTIRPSSALGPAGGFSRKDTGERDPLAIHSNTLRFLRLHGENRLAEDMEVAIILAHDPQLKALLHYEGILGELKSEDGHEDSID